MKSIAVTVAAMSRVSAVLLAASLTSGCAGVGAARDTASADRTRGGEQLSRTQRVFLYQSRVADALLDEYPLFEAFENASPLLIEAEAQMTESCSPLTQAVLAHVEGGKPSLGLRLRVMTTIDECERAARTIDRLLNAPASAGTI